MGQRYVSPKEYVQLFPGIGVETVKKMLREEKLNGYIDKNSKGKYSHYHIFIDDTRQIQYTDEYIRSLEVKIAKYEEKFKMLFSILTI